MSILKRKRGQVTIFIIVGVIILIAFIAIFAIRSYVTQSRITEVSRPAVEDIPTEFEPIRVFTENCLDIVGERALIRLGQQGGYIYPEEWSGLDFDEENPTDADGLAFPGSELKIPYWWYNVQANDGNAIVLSRNNQPTIVEMEGDLARYIDLELTGCLDGYASFEPQGFKVEEGVVDSQVEIVPGRVKFLVRHPLNIQKDRTQSKLENFYVEIPVDLVHIYEIASLVTEVEQNSTFLENQMLNLINMYSDVDENSLPPMTAQTFAAGSIVTWRKDEVKENLKSVLMNYIPFLRYYQSRNYFSYNFPDTEPGKFQERVYNDMVLPLSGAEDLEVRFQYLDIWDIFFDMNTEGELIEPSSITVDLYVRDFSWQRYHNLYDISYPVFISLYSPEAFDGEGYYFNFALESNLRNNQPVEADQSLLPLVSSSEQSLFCNTNQRNSGNITVQVIDKYSREPLAGAGIIFSAGDENCNIGLTDANGIYTGQFPIAIGGIVSATKEGYLMTSDLLDTELHESGSASLELWKLQPISIGALKKKIFNCKDSLCFPGNESTETAANPLEAGLLLANLTDDMAFVNSTSIQGSNRAGTSSWYFSKTNYGLKDNERAIVFLKRVSANDKPLESAATLRGTETQQIQLAPGDYEVIVQSIVDENFTIPAEGREVEGEEFTIQETSMATLPNGGLTFKEPYFLTIEPSDLYAASKINMVYAYFALSDIPMERRVAEDLPIIGQLGSVSIVFAEDLQPIFT